MSQSAASPRHRLRSPFAAASAGCSWQSPRRLAGGHHGDALPLRGAICCLGRKVPATCRLIGGSGRRIRHGEDYYQAAAAEADRPRLSDAERLQLCTYGLADVALGQMLPGLGKALLGIIARGR